MTARLVMGVLVLWIVAAIVFCAYAAVHGLATGDAVSFWAGAAGTVGLAMLLDFVLGVGE